MSDLRSSSLSATCTAPGLTTLFNIAAIPPGISVYIPVAVHDGHAQAGGATPGEAGPSVQPNVGRVAVEALHQCQRVLGPVQHAHLTRRGTSRRTAEPIRLGN